MIYISSVINSNILRLTNLHFKPKENILHVEHTYLRAHYG